MTVRVATDGDVASLAALRRAWTDEYTGRVDDAGAFEREFAAWYAVEPARTTWIAIVGAATVGMLNLAEFRRMPRPGMPPSRWGYIANLFVLAAHRNRGLGRELLDAALAAARERHYARLVLSPSPRSVPFYRRAGFAAADELLVLRLP
jgi:GNAT superfamily N-acetyltransferase